MKIFLFNLSQKDKNLKYTLYVLLVVSILAVIWSFYDIISFNPFFILTWCIVIFYSMLFALKDYSKCVIYNNNLPTLLFSNKIFIHNLSFCAVSIFLMSFRISELNNISLIFIILLLIIVVFYLSSLILNTFSKKLIK